jgi:hypothetical protein
MLQLNCMMVATAARLYMRRYMAKTWSLLIE